MGLPLASNLPGLNERRTVLRQPLVLTAALVYHEVFTADFEYMNLYLGYIRGAAGGAFRLEAEYSPFVDAQTAIDAGVAEWYRDSAFAVGAVAAGVDTLSLVQRENISYTSVGGTLETLVIPVLLQRGTERMRFGVIETGVVGTPGTLQLTTYKG